MDKALLEELYQRYGPEIFRYLYAMCRDRLLAEDVMQDAKPCECPCLAVHGWKKPSDQ